MNEASVIFPHQLFEHHPALKKERRVFLVEHPHFYTRYKFHKQKIAFHHATILEYELFLKERGYQVNRVALETDLWQVLSHEKIQRLHCALLHDKVLEEHVMGECKKGSLEIHFYESPYFMSDSDRFNDYFLEKETFYFTSFYREQRHHFAILMTHNDTPKGGKLTFDTENRKKLSRTSNIPPVPVINKNASIKKAILSASRFEDHPGSLEEWHYPVNFKQAHDWLDTFLAVRLPEFGPYQDAISLDQSVLFHSLLSPLLNVGLLTPKGVIEKTLDYAENHAVPLNSLEGFIRQIIGWREFVYGIYRHHSERQQQSNYFDHTAALPKSFWEGDTGLEPVDCTIERVLKTAYAHHIERLMVLGNIMLLSEVNPHEVYRWFMEFFIDAYDWVMIPNVYGMSQYADGGLMTTKPYIAGGNYIKKMSTYKPGVWEIVYTDLYWRFLARNYERLLPSARMQTALMGMRRMSHSKLTDHIERAELFLKELRK